MPVGRATASDAPAVSPTMATAAETETFWNNVGRRACFRMFNVEGWCGEVPQQHCGQRAEWQLGDRGAAGASALRSNFTKLRVAFASRWPRMVPVMGRWRNQARVG